MWSTVPICDDHWKEQEGDRKPVRIRGSSEDCYLCGGKATIYVRRKTEDIRPIERRPKPRWEYLGTPITTRGRRPDADVEPG